jgi:hypothetical protein
MDVEWAHRFSGSTCFKYLRFCRICFVQQDTSEIIARRFDFLRRALWARWRMRESVIRRCSLIFLKIVREAAKWKYYYSKVEISLAVYLSLVQRELDSESKNCFGSSTDHDLATRPWAYRIFWKSGRSSRFFIDFDIHIQPCPPSWNSVGLSTLSTSSGHICKMEIKSGKSKRESKRLQSDSSFLNATRRPKTEAVELDKSCPTPLSTCVR